jgi:hypothetical protein
MFSKKLLKSVVFPNSSEDKHWIRSLHSCQYECDGSCVDNNHAY